MLLVLHSIRNFIALEILWNITQLILTPKGKHLSTKYCHLLVWGFCAFITNHFQDLLFRGTNLKALWTSVLPPKTIFGKLVHLPIPVSLPSVWSLSCRYTLIAQSMSLYFTVQISCGVKWFKDLPSASSKSNDKWNIRRVLPPALGTNQLVTEWSYHKEFG